MIHRRSVPLLLTPAGIPFFTFSLLLEFHFYLLTPAGILFFSSLLLEFHFSSSYSCWNCIFPLFTPTGIPFFLQKNKGKATSLTVRTCLVRSSKNHLHKPWPPQPTLRACSILSAFGRPRGLGAP